MPGATPQGHGAFLVDLSGQVVRVPTEGVQEALRSGFVAASDKQVQDLKFQEKYGTTGQQLITGVEHAGSALTLGGSTVAERALGVPAEDIAGRERANPVAAGVGTGIGIAAPLILTAGAAAPVEAGAMGAARGAAELTAPSLVARAGRAVTGAVRSALPVAESAAGRIAAKAAASGAGSAIEGAAYGLGHVVHEAALGDPNLTAQSALSEIGLAGLFGGGVGAAGGALSGLAKEATPSDLGQKLSGWLGEAEGNRNIKAAGAIQSDVTRAGKQIGRENLNKIGREMGEMGLVSPFSTPAKTLERAQEMLDGTGTDIGNFLQRADVVEGSAPPSIGDVLGRVKSEVLAPLEKNPLQREAAGRLAGVLEGYESKFAQPGSFGKGTLTFADMHGMRREISDALYGLRGNMDPFANAYKDALHDFRGILSDEINSGLDRSGVSSDAWKALNRRYEVASRAAEFAQKGIDRAHGNNLVSPTEILGGIGGVIHGGPLGGAVAGAATAAVRRYSAGILGAAARGLREYLDAGAAESVSGKTAELVAASRQAGSDAVAAAAGNAPETIAVLSQLERASAATSRKIESGASMLVRGSERAAGVGRSEAAAGIASMFGRDPEVSQVQHQARMEDIQRLALDPAEMQRTLEQHVQDLHDHAPNTAQAMAITSGRAVSFLASKLPHTPQAGPLAPKMQPSSAEIARFSRYYEAVNRPTSVLKQAAAGTLTPDAVEAIREVYPEMYAKIQAAIAGKLVTRPKSVSYRSKMMMSMLLGQDMDGSMNAATILGAQRAYSAPSAKSPQNQMRSGKGPSAITLSNRLLTPGQASANRR